MKNSLVQLQVFYEIAMSIGNSLDINKMLQESLTAYLRKLNCFAGAVVKIEESPGERLRLAPLYSIPREITRNVTCLHALGQIPEDLPRSGLPGFLKNLPINGRYNDSHFYHIMELPDFGLLLLTKSSTDLEPPVLRSLINLNEKLARSCIACFQNEKIKQTNEQLENEIRHREQMEEALLKANKLKAIGVLAGGVAHDFNNLLAVILGNVSLAKMETEPEKGNFDFLNEIEKASLKAIDLTQKFITFSSGGTLIRKLLALPKLVKNVVELECSGSNVECQFSFPADLWKVEGDEGQIKQVFYNIIENSIEAMPRGGTINICTENIEIPGGALKNEEAALSLSNGSYVKVGIKDHGRGIPESDLPNVFDPYYSTKQRGPDKGMGLGLTIAYSIVGKHGGSIHIESECGKGTEVYVYLPAIPVKTIKKTDPDKTATAPRKRILVMDDEKMMLNLSFKMLKRLGCEVELTKNGEEALEMYEKALNSGMRFDAVILDLTVKRGMDGEAAIKQLLQIDPEVKAIVTSGYSTNPIIAEFSRYGFKGALAKPFRLNQLNETLKRLLED